MQTVGPGAGEAPGGASVADCPPEPVTENAARPEDRRPHVPKLGAISWPPPKRFECRVVTIASWRYEPVVTKTETRRCCEINDCCLSCFATDWSGGNAKRSERAPGPVEVAVPPYPSRSLAWAARALFSAVQRRGQFAQSPKQPPEGGDVRSGNLRQRLIFEIQGDTSRAHADDDRRVQPRNPGWTIQPETSRLSRLHSDDDRRVQPRNLGGKFNPRPLGSLGSTPMTTNAYNHEIQGDTAFARPPGSLDCTSMTTHAYR